MDNEKVLKEKLEVFKSEDDYMADASDVASDSFEAGWNAARDWHNSLLNNKPKEPEIGSWCKFWDTEDEPNIKSSKIGRLKIIDRTLTYPYATTYGVVYKHCKQLKGSLEEVKE